MPNQWNAAEYDAKHSFVYEKGKGVVELLAPQPGERILDLGCGTGALTAEIAASGADIRGIDSSEEMISQARKKFPALKFQVLDARELPFRAEFDAIFSNAVLHWIPEPEKVIAGVAKALKPAGRFVAEFGGNRNLQKLVAGFRRAFSVLGIREPEGVSPWFYPSIAEYASLLEGRGLEVREASLFDRPTKLEGGERGLENWIRMFRQTFLEKMGEPNAQQWIKEVERQCRSNLFKNGNWELDYRRLRIAAWKP
jgi:trans-aconitate methyltransferase